MLISIALRTDSLTFSPHCIHFCDETYKSKSKCYQVWFKIFMFDGISK